MNPRDCLGAFWAGERPEQIPYTIYWVIWRDYAKDPAWLPLFKAGLRITHPAFVAARQMNGVDCEDTTHSDKGDTIRRLVMKTAVGEVSATWRNGWQDTYWLKTVEDYRVVRYIVEHTTFSADHDATARTESELGEFAVVHAWIGRTPLQTILVDYAGLENFGIHLLTYEEEVRGLYDALLDNFRRMVEITAQGTARYVTCIENFTAETIGPACYRDCLLPVYKECFPVLQSAGKIVSTHYDGKIASCKDLVAEAPIDMIESFTTPPEGDMTLREARTAWPDKLIWSNINVAAYDLAPAALRQKVLSSVEDGAPDGRGLAFEVSEDLPGNWRESLPVVLDALRETRTAGKLT